MCNIEGNEGMIVVVVVVVDMRVGYSIVLLVLVVAVVDAFSIVL